MIINHKVKLYFDDVRFKNGYYNPPFFRIDIFFMSNSSFIISEQGLSLRNKLF